MQITASSDTLPSDPGGQRLKTLATLGCAALLLAAVAVVFWYQDGRYSLPTPKPSALAVRSLGESVDLPAGVPLAANDPRPVLLHFFNPDCPCSRFNAGHLRALRLRFGARVRFVAVVQTFEDGNAPARRAGLEAAARLLGPDMETVVDDGGKIAAACGVYSTPQAAILTAGAAPTLLFRGNYNSTRYCADPKTEFVRLALDAIVSHRPLPPESQAAMVAYGCELPANLIALRNLSSPAKL